MDGSRANIFCKLKSVTVNDFSDLEYSHLGHHADDVTMAISPEDFPGDERLAKVLIEEMREEYRDDAQMASMTFCRGSVLMQEAQEFTRNTIDRYLGL